MKLEQLEQIVAIEKYGSVSKAAKSMYLSPATLSNNLSALEMEIGVRLFERNPTGVVPTSEGKEIIGLACQVLDTCQQITDYGNLATTNDVAGSVTVLIAPVFQLLFSDITIQFRKKYPKAKLHLSVLSPDDAIQRIMQHTGNIGLILAPVSDDFIKLLQENGLHVKNLRFCYSKLFTSREHRLAKLETVSTRDWYQEQFVTYSEDHWSSKNKHIKTDKQPLWIEDLEVMKQIIHDGEAIGCFPEILFLNDWRLQQGEICEITVSDMQSKSNVLLIYPEKRKLNLLEQYTITLMEQIVLDRIPEKK